MAMQETGTDNETFDFEAALDNYSNSDFGDLEEGSLTTGEIVQIDDATVLVDVNFKSEGQIPTSEFRDIAGNITVKVGDKIDVYVVRKNEMEGTITLSFEKAKRMQVFDQLERVQENNETISGKIMRRIKGGYTVDIGGVEAFLPGSHVDLRPVPDMDALVNQEYEFRVLKINRRRSNVIVSRRVLLEEERDNKRQQLLETLSEGQIVEGKAKNITEYGVFVDLGGLDGLLHITDMSWRRIRHPKELITLGQDLTLKVLSFDRENCKVSLGLKQLVPDPWEAITTRFPVNSKATGKVTNLVDYGAFVELEPGVEGLVHISEMSWTRKLRHPSQLIHTGDEVEVVILGVDAEKKRISLGMKQVRPNPWELVAEKYPEGTILEGTIKNITEFGMFIGIEDGIDGLIHVSDISWTKKIRHPSEVYKVGDTVQAKVLTVD
ncbi:MAG: 30S ribosomal protein S1, partial [Desulfovibrio sp.]|nr:30S ribosomal protein S1 [Desulfovibrio sp.]